jgi:hypothetical protein
MGMSTETSTAENETTTESTVLGIGPLVRRGALAAVVVALANAVLVLVTTSVGVAPDFRPLSLPPVLFLSTLGVLGATVTYWVLVRRASNPDRTFTRVASVVLVVSLLPDVALLSGDPAATVPGVVVLMAMHVVAAAVSVAVLTGRIP